MARPPSLQGRERPFRVRAQDAEDLAVVSAYLQDAVLPVAEIAYEPAEERFVLVAARFRWEKAVRRKVAAEGGEPDERVHCGVRFEAVTAVRARGVDPKKDRGRMLNLLQIAWADGHVDLICADEVTIRLDVRRLACHVEDLGEPWPTVFRPTHED
jgi:prepilin-type processing-associated H-X9-DG protein